MSDRARALLEGDLQELGFAPDEEALKRLLRLAELVEAWGSRMNLSGHREADAVLQHLVMEAAALLVAMPPFVSLADLGSGAGFPGLPLAILRPAAQVTLVESRLRRHHFQRAARRTLGLENVRLLRGRAEELPAAPHAAVVAQAMARPSRALRWMRSWSEPHGWLLLPCRVPVPEIPVPDGVEFVETRRYRVPRAGHERALWLGRRTP